MATLRVLQVNAVDLGGGAFRSAWNLLEEYRRLGLSSHLAVGRKLSNDDDVIRIPNGVWSALRHHADRMHPTMGRGLRAAAKALWLCNRERVISLYQGKEDFAYPGTWRLLDLPPFTPDVVHCHNLHGKYFDLRALPWLSSRVPVIINARDLWLITGHCAMPIECERWKVGCGSCVDLKAYPSVRKDSTAHNWRRKSALFKGSRLYVTAVSDWAMDAVRGSMLEAVSYKVIPNGIDTNTFRLGDRAAARRTLGLPIDSHVIVITGHNVYKNFNVMERVLSGLRVPDGRPFIVVCLGRSGPSRALGPGIIHFPGFIDREDILATYYQSANAYFHVATGESFGKTITEAMACGIPVVANAVGGIPEQIADSVTGYLVATSDEAAMRGRLEKLLSNPVEAGRMGLQARSIVLGRFSLNLQARAFIQWYQDVRQDWEQWKHSKEHFSVIGT